MQKKRSQQIIALCFENGFNGHCKSTFVEIGTCGVPILMLNNAFIPETRITKKIGGHVTTITPQYLGIRKSMSTALRHGPHFFLIEPDNIGSASRGVLKGKPHRPHLARAEHLPQERGAVSHHRVGVGSLANWGLLRHCWALSRIPAEFRRS